jgi:hypothetical protein
MNDFRAVGVIVGLVVGRGMRMAAMGVVIGVLCAAVGLRMLRGFL